MTDQLKIRIPWSDRKWDPGTKRWLISRQYAQVCVDLASAYLGVTLVIPKQTVTTIDETKIVTLEYLGSCKLRGDESTALGWVDGNWSMVFPESVLRSWFCSEKSPTEKPTLYAVLAVKKDVAPDALRSAYRRMARSYHPDVCHEPDAEEQFKAIQHAYEVLSEPRMRKKYDAGILLSASVRRDIHDPHDRYAISRSGFANEYRSPLRCGYVMVHGAEVLGRFVVDEIKLWEDITGVDGRVMVTSWPAGADKFTVAWQ